MFFMPEEKKRKQTQKKRMSYTGIHFVPMTDEIRIRAYSVDFCGMLMLTIITWMWMGSWTKDPVAHRDESMWYRFNGFVFFWWPWMYGFWSLIQIMRLNNRRSRELSDDARTVEMTGTAPVVDPGYPASESEHHIEYTRNTALYFKYIIFWFGMWPPMFKISFDDNNEYSWAATLSLWLAYTVYLTLLAWNGHRYFPIDQRAINIQDAHELAMRPPPVRTPVGNNNNTEGSILTTGDEDDILLSFQATVSK
jgi:hypothetical protein